MEPLRIHLFGGFLLERGASVLPPIASRAGRSLFAYLVANRHRPIQRDLVAGLFWPDLPDGRARRRLSHTLWQIQDALSPITASHLLSTADTLTFDTSLPYWLDVEEFDLHFSLSVSRSEGPREALDSEALRTCIELYRGDFLAGFFDDWAIVEQEHYLQRYLLALRRMIDLTKADGAYEEALTYARRLTHHDPLSEETHQEAMRLCFLLGRTNEAVQQFERCRSVLAEELGSEPSQATIDLHQRILKHRRAGINSPIGPRSPVPLGNRIDAPFVGREDERRRLVDQFERVLAGPGGVVLVEGEPGVGKSRLAVEMASDAEWRGFEVSWGSCSPGALRPFAPLVEVLQSLSPLRIEQLAELVEPLWLGEALRLAPQAVEQVTTNPLPAPRRPGEGSVRMREALVNTIGAIGKITPHLLVIDDVHWADRDTLAVLEQLGRRLSDSRLLVLLLYRSEEARGDPQVWNAMRGLDRSAGLGRVVLSPLSVFELDEIVKRVLGVSTLGPATTARLHSHTGGNALFALETLLAMRDEGLFDMGHDPGLVLDQQLKSRALPVGPRVRGVINSRMSLLSEDVSHVYEAAAVFGDPVDTTILGHAAELRRAVVVDALDELLHRGLMQDNGEARYRIAHDQVRQVIYERIPTERRRQLHQRIAEALTSREPHPVEAIGYHFQRAEIPDRAASFLLEAGLRAIDLNAYVTAGEHLEAAREAAGQAEWSATDRYRVLGQLEAVLSVLGHRERQQETLAEMTALVSQAPQLKGDIERRRAWLLAHMADLANAENAARLSVDAERKRGDRAGTAASLVALGTVLRWSGRTPEAVAHLEEAVAEAEGHAEQRAAALTELGSTLVEVQRADEALTHLDEAASTYRGLGDLRGDAEVTGIRARALRQRGDAAAASAAFEHAIELSRGVGYRHGEAVNLGNLGTLDQLSGRVAHALVRYDRAVSIFADLGNRRGEANVLANAASARHHLLGDDNRAHSDAAKAKEIFAEIGDHAREAQCLEILAGIKARQGAVEEANALLEESLAVLANSGNRYLEGQHLRSLALLLIDRGDSWRALEVVDAGLKLCNQASLPHLGVDLLSVKGVALCDVGKETEGVAATRQAVAGLTPAVERPYLIYHRHSLVSGKVGLDAEAAHAALEAHRLLGIALEGLTEAELASAIEQVPEHRSIVHAGRQLVPRVIEVSLPSAVAPTGRCLDKTELRQVMWTVDHPGDHKVDSPVTRRRHRVLRLISEAGAAGAAPSIAHIANALGVSESTIRRDLLALREAGHEIDTRGQRAS